MLTKDKIPFINEGSNMKDALKIITQKKLGTLIVKNKKGNTTGIITDGQIRRVSQKNKFLHSLQIKKVMTKNPIKVNKEILAIKALAIMNEKKITSLLVVSDKDYKKKNRIKLKGIIHIHFLLRYGLK